MCEAGQGFALFEAGLNITWICGGTSVLVNVLLFNPIIALWKQNISGKSIKIFKVINMNTTAAIMSRSAVTLHKGAAMLCRRSFH